MAIYRNIDDFTAGNTYAIIRNTTPASNGFDLPSDAWFTVKNNLTDNDSMAVLQVHITTSGTVNGLITINPDNSSVLTFISLVTNSYNMQPLGTFFYDIKIKMLPSGYVYTLETGKLFTTEGVTTLPSS